MQGIVYASLHLAVMVRCSPLFHPLASKEVSHHREHDGRVARAARGQLATRQLSFEFHHFMLDTTF